MGQRLSIVGLGIGMLLVSGVASAEDARQQLRERVQLNTTSRLQNGLQQGSVHERIRVTPTNQARITTVGDRTTQTRLQVNRFEPRTGAGAGTVRRPEINRLTAPRPSAPSISNDITP